MHGCTLCITEFIGDTALQGNRNTVFKFEKKFSTDYQSKGEGKPHIIFSYNVNIFSEFLAQEHVNVNGEVEQNYSNVSGIKFVA